MTVRDAPDVVQPQSLWLTPTERKHLALPGPFVDQFPQEWLFSRSLIGQIAQWVDESSHPSIIACSLSWSVHSIWGDRGAAVCPSFWTSAQHRMLHYRRYWFGQRRTARNALTKMFLAVEGQKYIGPRGGFSSGSAVVEGLKNQPNMWLAVDEFGKKIAAYGSRPDQIREKW